MNERTGDLTFDVSHEGEGELRVGARLRSAVDFNRFIDSLYHVAFLLWPKEITELAAGEDAGDRPAMMRAGAAIATEAPKTAADRPAGAALPSPRLAPESQRPATGRGSQAGRPGNPRAGDPIIVSGVSYPTKRAAIVALFKAGVATPVIIAKVGTTPDGYKAAMKAAKRLGELPRQ